MKLKSIEFTNFRSFYRGNISFENDLTVIIGKNGAGKTSVLKAAAIALSWLRARLMSKTANGQYIDPLSITNGHSQSKLHVTLQNTQTIDIPNKAVKGVNKKYELDVEALKEWGNQYREEIERTNYMTSVPVYVYYGVERSVIDIPLRIHGKDYNLLDTYKDSLSGSANFRDFFTWFRNQEDIENQYLVRSSRIDGFCATRELDVFRRAMESFMPEYTNFHVERGPLRMMADKSGIAINVSQMSDGEKIYLALIGDLCHRLVLGNPTLQNPLLGEGVVLIDEIDLHLHPEWQGELASRLNKAFPNVQFIITTHSPHVVNSVPTRCIRILENGMIQENSYGYGLPLNIVLKDVMGLSMELPKEVKKQIDDVYNAIQEGNLENAQDASIALEQMVPEQPELVRIRKILERMQRH